MEKAKKDHRFDFYNSLKPQKNYFAENYKHLKNEQRYDYIYLSKQAGCLDGKKILDSACATGDLLDYVSRENSHCFGFDYSKPFIYTANKSKPHNHNYAVCNAEYISFKSESFDVVFSSHFVEHLYEDELLKYLKEVRRNLKPSGKIVVHTCPNKWYRYTVYRFYSRWIRMVLYPFLNLFFKNKISQIPSMDEFKKQDLQKKENKLIHVNEKSVRGLKNSLLNAGFEDTKVWAFGEPFKFNLWALPIYIVDLLYPLPKIFPVLFANHVWAVGTK